MRLIVLEGGHGAGTSFHSQALAKCLDGIAWSHTRHAPGLVGVPRVRHYEKERRRLARIVAENPQRVFVLDRGPWSSVAHLLDVGAKLPLALALTEADRAAWQSATTIYLDAPDADLDARLAARPEAPSDSWGERTAWRRLAALQKWPSVDTSQPTPDVTRALLRLSLKSLGVEVSL